MTLQCCLDCEALWVSVPHETYAAFEFVTHWRFSESQWRAVHNLNDAKTLHEWHDAVIRESSQSLPDAGIANVERWLNRSYRHYNPIDRGPDVKLPTNVYQVADLQIVIDSLP